MRNKIVFWLVTLTLLPGILSGCGSKETTGSSVTENSPEKEKSTIARNSPHSDAGKKQIGVILDTVADVFKEASTQSERVSQAIYNQPVEILEEQESWYRVKVIDGYTGWIKEKHITKDSSSLRDDTSKYRIIVTAKKSKVLSEPKYGATVKDVVLGTEFNIKNSQEGWYEVCLPQNKTGWINESGVIHLSLKEHIPKTSAKDFIATSMKFKGTVYLWGGISAWEGIDCSGLTYISARINGIDLPRDADQQFKVGNVVEKNMEKLLPGDLLYFSSSDDQKDISHVGIYVGGGQMVNASKSQGSVTVSTISDNYFQKRLVGAKRIF